MENLKKVLIIEDDPNIIDLVRIHLQDLGMVLVEAQNGATGIRKALEYHYDLIILDLMLPKVEGFEICKKIRAENSITPILMLTAKNEELDRVLGLEIGADDYLTKPFSVRELIARIKAIFRRMEVNSKESEDDDVKILQFGDLKIDPVKRKVQLTNQTVELTAKEFDLLVQFAKHPGRTYDR